MNSPAQRILREVYLLRDNEFALTWTPQIFSDKLRIDLSATAQAIRWLLDNKLMELDGHGHYWCTAEGERALQRAAARPTAAGNEAARYKHEVLTGMDAAGNETRIKRGVLPTGVEARKAPVDVQAQNRRRLMNSIKAVCAESGKSMEEVASLMADGRVKECRICGEVRLHGKKGEYVRDKCNFCRNSKPEPTNS